MNRKRILFVDDEPAVLQSLSNLLRKDRHRWDLVFAPGGPQALAELDHGAFDVVVTDMRMPEVDGVALLEVIKARSPRTARIMLSGHADSGSVLQALPLVHQFLAKPCDIKTIRASIERACSELLPADKSLAGPIGSMPCLPSCPTIYEEVRRLAQDPATTIAQMIAVVERDPALAAKVLQIANTAYFGTGAPVSSIALAVSALGLEVMRPLATSTMVRAPIGLCLRVIEQLCEHAVQAADRARRAVEPALADAAYAAALLHDIGRLVLADELAESYAPVLDRVARTNEPLAVVEAELLGLTHEAVAGHLLAMWALPAPIVEAIAHHHGPSATDPLAVATQAAAGAD